jgi:hypothetical protein
VRTSMATAMSILTVVTSILTWAGCDGVASGTTAPSLHVPPSPVQDAGVVFADRENYLCVPITRLAIDPHDADISAKSSCECMRPSIVRYLTQRDEVADALRVDYMAEQPSSGAPPSQMRIRIEVTLSGMRASHHG